MSKRSLLFLIIITLIAGLSACQNGVPEDIPEHEKLLVGFSVNLRQGAVEAEVTADIDHNSGTVTLEAPQRWIDNIRSAAACFSTIKGVTVKVDHVLQESGRTLNDFTNDVEYVLRSDNGFEKKYTVRLLSPQSTGLPLINIVTDGGQPVIDKDNYIEATVGLTDYSDPVNEFERKPAGIRGRGNSTWEYDKKPYRIKFDAKTSLFGLGKAKSWVLLANYLDPTLMTGTVAFELGRKMNFPFTNNANHVELFLNGKYEGSYVLTEQVQVNEHRVDIDEDNDIFLELDTYFDETYKFRSGYLKLPVNIKSPELEELPADEAERIRTGIETVFNEMESSVFSPDFPNNNYRELIDIYSVIDYMLLNEVVRNAEIIHPKSVFIYKTNEGKFCFGPIWDFDWGFGYNGNGFEYFEKTALIFSPDKDPSVFYGYKFFLKFFQDPFFVSEYKKRWNNIKKSVQDIPAFIEATGSHLSKSAAENKRRWAYYKFDHKSQVAEMKKWLEKRIVSLDSEINRF